MSNSFCRTNDGSTSLIDSASGQTMHAKEGAFSETLYIYGQNLEWAIKNNFPLKICVMGLGLGYIELISLALILQSQRSQEPIEILSFEKSDEFRESFLNWLVDPSEKRDKNLELKMAYNEILKLIETHLSVNSEKLKKFALELYQTNKWHFFKDPLIDMSWKKMGPFHVIQYDPFSKSANPELWQLTWLKEFITTLAGTPCAFATYASNGGLKKALSQSDFNLQLKSGFGSKRESTFAIRELS